MTTLSPGLRKLLLTAHVACSVGWLGAVAGFLAVAVAGLQAEDEARARAAYVAMAVMAWWVIVPLGLASPLTGIVQGLLTPWGLVRHWWVIAKTVITLPCTAFLLLHLQTIDAMAVAAADPASGMHALGPVKFQLVVEAGAAVGVLLMATVFSVYKPRGLTRYGQRVQREQRAG